MSEIKIDEVAVEAYTYLYPLVVMEVTRRQILSLNAAKYGPENLFIHNRSMANEKWRSVARTNIDIDEEACRRVMERFNLTTMKDAVNLALRALAIEPMTLEEALAMRGTGWEGDLAAMRTPRT